MLREGSGSQLRVSITVSHHSDWWLTVCLCYTPKNCQGDKHQSSTRPRPSTRRFPFSNFIFYPVRPVLHYYQHFSYFTLIKWHLLVVVRWSISAPCVVISYTAWWGQTDTATSWRWDPAPCWRWTGLLHLLWEADCRGEEMRGGVWG